MALERRVVMLEVVQRVRAVRGLAWVMFFALPMFVVLAFMHMGSWLAAPAAEPIVADAVVVLGGDGGSGRTKRAGELFLSGFAPLVVLTGHPGGPGMRVDVKTDPRVKLLVSMGVPLSALLFDSASRNSWEEAINGRRMMYEKGWHRILVVSDPPHLRRLDLVWGYALAGSKRQFVLVASDMDWWYPKVWWQDGRTARFVGRELLGLCYYVLLVFYSALSEGLLALCYNSK